MQQKQVISPLKKPKDDHISILNEYYSNGFQRVKAIQTVFGKDYSVVNAHRYFDRILNNPRNITYIRDKRDKLKKSTDIHNENILRELINFAYSDITDYLGLSDQELKELPSDVKRCISRIESKERTFTNRAGNEVTERTNKIWLVDKLKSIEMINKHIGFFAVDNKQKQVKINIESLNVETLNALLMASNELQPGQQPTLELPTKE